MVKENIGIKKSFYIKIHPGEVLQDILDGNGVSQTKLARHSRMPQSKISDICTGKRGISPEMAMKLGRTFGQTPDFWLNLQKNWELASLDQSNFKHVKQMRLSA